MLDGTCSSCKNWSPEVTWDNLCPACAKDQETTVAVVPGDVRGECDNCHCFSSDLRVKHGQIVCAVCETFMGMHRPRMSVRLHGDNFACGYFWGAVTVIAVFVLSYLVR